MPAAPIAPEASAARARRKGEQTAERILNAAEELFAERGYAGTTLRDIAERVGLRNPSLYNHFPNKESLYAAVLERGIGPVFEALSEFVAGDDDSRNSAKMVETIMQLLAQRPSLPRLVLQEQLSGGERLTPMLRDWIGPTLARGQELVEATPSARTWSPEQIPLLVLAMYHIVIGYFTVAPLYQDLNGEDLMTKQALAQQTRLIIEISEILFPERGSD